MWSSHREKANNVIQSSWTPRKLLVMTLWVTVMLGMRSNSHVTAERNGFNILLLKSTALVSSQIWGIILFFFVCCFADVYCDFNGRWIFQQATSRNSANHQSESSKNVFTNCLVGARHNQDAEITKVFSKSQQNRSLVVDFRITILKKQIARSILTCSYFYIYFVLISIYSWPHQEYNVTEINVGSICRHWVLDKLLLKRVILLCLCYCLHYIG